MNLVQVKLQIKNFLNLEAFSLQLYATILTVNQEDMVMFNLILQKQHKNVLQEHKTLKLKKKLLTFKFSKRKMIVKMQEKIFTLKTYQTKLISKINLMMISKLKLKINQTNVVNNSEKLNHQLLKEKLIKKLLTNILHL